MSYRPEEQELQKICEKLISDIEEFSKRIDARMNSGEWKSYHISTINQLRIKLLQLKPEIHNLKEETW